MTIGPGGCGRWIRQSAPRAVRQRRLEARRRRAAARGSTISRSWISPKAPRVCLFDRMSCSPSTSPDSFSILVCARSMASSRAAARRGCARCAVALAPRLSPIACVTSASRLSIACDHARLRRGLRLGDVGEPPCSCCWPSFSARTAPSSSARWRASGSTARAERATAAQQQDGDEQRRRRRPEPRVVERDRRAADA